MTDRGLPIVDGAPACPFVAFEDDRDGRATAPDHRHRCYAEARPAPRALAHQEAYCLSSAFPVCPTFQDWARREAAAARSVLPDDRASHDEAPPVSSPLPPRDREGRRAPDTDTPPPLPPRRHQPREWAAPPPWAGEEASREPFEDAAPPAFLAGREPTRSARDDDWSAASRGLAGSAADRLAGPDPDLPAPMPPVRPSRGQPAYRAGDAFGAGDGPDDADEDEDEYEEARAWAPTPARQPASRRVADRAADRGERRPPSREHVRRQDEEAEELFGPAWERPRRYEAYPMLRTRVGLPHIPGLWVSVAALLLAAVVLFFVGPMLLGLGGKGPDTGGGPSPSVSAAPSESPSPTVAPAPTPQVYTVVANDTLSKIANKFGVTVADILAANPKIKDPNKIAIGDQITIPVPAPSEVPNQVNGSTGP